MYRIGHIFSGKLGPSWLAFVQGLSSLGWVEGENFVFEHRDVSYTGLFVESKSLAVAEDLVRTKVDLIVLTGGARAQIVQKVAGTIPIVVMGAAELVASDIVQSLARPGGTITGTQAYSPELQGKRLQILKELAPTLINTPGAARRPTARCAWMRSRPRAPARCWRRSSGTIRG